IAAIVGDPPQAAGTPAVMASLNEVLHDAAMRMPEARASLVDVHYWGDANATAHVRIEDGPDLKHVTELRYSLSSGAFREAWALSETSGGRVYAAMTPLHYGTFGGIALKALYAVLGLASSFVVASGMVVWLERRAQRGTGVSQRVSGVWVGASTGMLLATAGALALHHALPSSTDRVFGTGLTYAGLWVLAVGYAAWRAEDRTALRHLLAATAVLLAMTPLIRLSVEGAELWSSSLPAVATDMTLIAVAIATAILTQAIPVPSTHEKSPRAVSPQRVPLTRSGVE
ncbi:MAG: PepSY-associated TM helix domain-containing protein, partial [Pseudomonadota bacterium]